MASRVQKCVCQVKSDYAFQRTKFVVKQQQQHTQRYEGGALMRAGRSFAAGSGRWPTGCLSADFPLMASFRRPRRLVHNPFLGFANSFGVIASSLLLLLRLLMLRVGLYRLTLYSRA